jgi:hypothetical protein
MGNADLLRRLRADAVARGLCMTCRIRRPRAGVKTCDVCLGHGKKVVQLRRARGGCSRCGAVLRDRFKLCRRCRKARRAVDQRRQQRLISAGQCIQHGGVPAVPGHVKCASCLDKLAAKALAHTHEKWRRPSAAPLLGLWCDRPQPSTSRPGSITAARKFRRPARKFVDGRVTKVNNRAKPFTTASIPPPTPGPSPVKLLNGFMTSARIIALIEHGLNKHWSAKATVPARVAVIAWAVSEMPSASMTRQHGQSAHRARSDETLANDVISARCTGAPAPHDPTVHRCSWKRAIPGLSETLPGSVAIRTPSTRAT